MQRKVLCAPTKTWHSQINFVGGGVHSLSHVWDYVTPWTAAHPASLSFTTSWSLLKLMSSRWCHPTISSSVVPFSSCLQSFPASGSFPVNQLFASGGQNFGASASSSVLSMNIQGWFPVGLTGLIPLLSKGLSEVFSSTMVWSQIFFFFKGAGSNSKGCIGLRNWKAKRHDANIRQILIQLSTFTKESWFLFSVSLSLMSALSWGSPLEILKWLPVCHRAICTPVPSSPRKNSTIPFFVDLLWSCVQDRNHSGKEEQAMLIGSVQIVGVTSRAKWNPHWKSGTLGPHLFILASWSTVLLINF